MSMLTTPRNLLRVLSFPLLNKWLMLLIPDMMIPVLHVNRENL
jgi:hypothetical protein